MVTSTCSLTACPPCWCPFHSLCFLLGPRKTQAHSLFSLPAYFWEVEPCGMPFPVTNFFSFGNFFQGSGFLLPNSLVYQFIKWWVFGMVCSLNTINSAGWAFAYKIQKIFYYFWIYIQVWDRYITWHLNLNTLKTPSSSEWLNHVFANME